MCSQTKQTLNQKGQPDPGYARRGAEFFTDLSFLSFSSYFSSFSSSSSSMVLELRRTHILIQAAASVAAVIGHAASRGLIGEARQWEDCAIFRVDQDKVASAIIVMGILLFN